MGRRDGDSTRAEPVGAVAAGQVDPIDEALIDGSDEQGVLVDADRFVEPDPDVVGVRSVIRLEALDADPAADDAALFRELYPSLRRFAAVVGDDDADPDDLVQEALVRALTRGPLHGLSNPGAYLRRSIVNVVIDSRRRGSRWRSVLGRTGRTDEHRDAPPSDLADLDQLSGIDRAVVWLTEVEGYPQADAAALLGLSHDAVRSRLSRSRRRLRAALQDREEP